MPDLELVRGLESIIRASRDRKRKRIDTGAASRRRVTAAIVVGERDGRARSDKCRNSPPAARFDSFFFCNLPALELRRERAGRRQGQGARVRFDSWVTQSSGSKNDT
ncbi:hypothetical protein EVAR_97973_1 [Eumeta japonica]|uniref:Uncharacterized protein n=1 Tax=Eumeta variegata TaxID=151549 RepID=A0A4C1XHD4_EUMVA|nr:hypothetical protein EVAR_97973_1 [Eumeta japonica]